MLNTWVDMRHIEKGKYANELERGNCRLPYNCPHISRVIGQSDNCRGIIISDIIYKILVTTLNDRLEKLTVSSICRYQCGFWSKRSATVQVFYNKADTRHELWALHTMFIDFKQAYSPVP